MRLDSYIHLTTLELPIKIDCGDFYLCSHEPIVVEIFGHAQKNMDFLFSHDHSLGIYGAAPNLVELVENIKEEIRDRWESGEDCRCDQCLNLQETFFEKKS